jgi:HK97 family phage prohead protease
VGHFATFNDWAEISSTYEGHFMERVAPGAFKKTFRENRDRMRVLFQHGQDPQIGDKPLGPIETLREDETGAFYEVPLLTDTAYVRELLPGLRKGLYGASFRFSVIKERFDTDAKVSTHNPLALPERTIQEAKVMEFGPVTFGAYDTATAGVRSLTDRLLGRAAGAVERPAREPLPEPVGSAPNPSWLLEREPPYWLLRRDEEPPWQLNRRERKPA